MQTAPSSPASPSQTSSSHTSSGLAYPHASDHLTGTKFVLTMEDKEILKDKYLKDFESSDRNLRKQVIGNAVRELALLHYGPEGTHFSKRKATQVCAIYSHM